MLQLKNKNEKQTHTKRNSPCFWQSIPSQNAFQKWGQEASFNFESSVPASPSKLSGFLVVHLFKDLCEFPGMFWRTYFMPLKSFI